MTILLSHITALSGILGYLFSERSRISHERGWAIIFIGLLAALSIYTFGILFTLIYPKVFFNRGSPPKEIFFKAVFEGLTEEEGLKSVLFDEVIRIQDRIERMEKENGIRIIPYKRALRISLFFIAIAIFIIIKTIYN